MKLRRVSIALLALGGLTLSACNGTDGGGDDGLFDASEIKGDVSTTGGSGSGSGSSTTAPSSTGDSAGADDLDPAVHFFVDERPHDNTDAEIEADEARWGDPIRVVIDGLEADKTVRVEFSTQSWGIFRADPSGVVDLARDPPMEGTWFTADADGPFWSAPESASPVFNVGVFVSDEATGTPLATGTVRRRTFEEGIEIQTVNEGTRSECSLGPCPATPRRNVRQS